MNIASILRHWFTLALTALTVFVGAHLLAPDETKAFDEAAKQLIAPLVIIGTLLVTAIWRMALAWIGNLFRTGSGEMKTNDSQGSGKSLGLWVLLGTTVVILGGLPSCSPELIEAARGVPVRIGVTTEYGTAAYSSKQGIEVDVDASGK